jgi:hypothetical protein
MIQRISVLLLLLLSSCKENTDKVAVINGVVRDEVTGLPVESANVAIMVDYVYDGQHYSNTIQGTTAITAPDGSYSINYTYDSEHPFLGEMNTEFPFPASHCTYAWREGYMGSDKHYLSEEKNDSSDLKLYPPARINVHAKNSGINNLSEVWISFDRQLYSVLYKKDEIIIHCLGTDFDSTFSLKTLWGNYKYYFTVMKCSNNAANCHGPFVFQRGSITPKADSIKELYISY